MKHAPTRSIPPPIDLSISGSNLFGTNSVDGSTKSCARGGQHPYASTCKYIIELDEGPPVPATTPPGRLNSLASPNPGQTQALLASPLSSNPPPSSTSTHSFVSASDWEDTRLVPNRRRRSCSEGAHLSDSPLASTHPQYGSASDGTPLTPKGTEFSANISPTPHRVLRQSTSFTLGFKHKSKAFPSVNDSLCDQTPKPEAGTVGRRSKLWSSIAHLPLSAGLGLDFGHNGDKQNTRSPNRKSKRPGTSPSTSSSWVSFTDTPASGGNMNRAGSLRKHHRPGTASCASSSSSSSPLWGSKLDWHRQWKRFSLLKPSSAPLTPVQTSPSTPSIPSYPSPLSASSTTSSVSFLPHSPNTQPTVPRTAANLSPRTPPSPKRVYWENNLTVFPNRNLQNRSTPNLQAPGLSMEDLGKINAFYAPPPPAVVVKAFDDPPRRRTASASGGSKLKPRLPLPPETSDPMPKHSSKQGGVSMQNTPKGKGISIALPLSPIHSVGGNRDSEDDLEVDVIYLTVEDVLDEESGETTLRLVEVPM